MDAHKYDNRSETIRDVVRLGLEKARVDSGDDGGRCVATLSYVFNHARKLSKRLTDARHNYHNLQVETMHVHIDHESRLRVVVLRRSAEPCGILPMLSSSRGA